MSQKTVYLAGPVRSVAPEDPNVAWRSQIEARLAGIARVLPRPGYFDDKISAPYELDVMERADVVLANMFTGSIGTTIGIVRAKQLGKPVFVVYPGPGRHPVLESLVGPGQVFRSLGEACDRVIAELKRPTVCPVVVTSSGIAVPFSERVLLRDITLAAARALVGDIGVEILVARPVAEEVRRRANERPGLTISKDEIRQMVAARLRALSDGADAHAPHTLRDHAEQVSAEWVNRVRASISESAEALEEWKRRYRELENRVNSDRWPPRCPEFHARHFKSVAHVLSTARAEWPERLAFARELSATQVEDYSAEGLGELYRLLDELGRFLVARISARAGHKRNERTLEQWFGSKGYAPTETAQTKALRKPFHFEGRTFNTYQHVKAHTLRKDEVRVYFDELAADRFVIGAVTHLPTASGKS